MGSLPGWLSFLDFLLCPLFVVLLLLMVFFTFTLLANIIAAPFNGFLAEKVEVVVRGEDTFPPFSWNELLAMVPRTLKRELRKLSYFLPRAIGLPRAMGILLTGRRVPAKEGYELGFVTAVAPAGGAMEEARKWAAQMLECSPLALRATKEVARKTMLGAVTGRPVEARMPAIEAFLRRKWERELEYRLIKEVWAFTGARIAVRFVYECRDADGGWTRAHGNEQWAFDERGLMTRREASINDVRITEAERLFRWPLGRRPDDHPGLSALGL